MDSILYYNFTCNAFHFFFDLVFTGWWFDNITFYLKHYIIEYKLTMGSGSDKPVNITKSLEEKEVKAIINTFHSIVVTDIGHKGKIEWILNPKEVSKKKLSKEGLCESSFVLAVEVLIKWMTTRVSYSTYDREDIFKLMLFIIEADDSNPLGYFESNNLSDITIITYTQAETLYNLIFNFLNSTSDVEYSPFPFLKSMFELDNRDNGDDTSKWKMEYDSFKFQVKRVIPFTIKYLNKYFETQTVYNTRSAVSRAGEEFWNQNTLNARSVKMPQLGSNILEQSKILNPNLWSTLFLALPKLELIKDIDLIFNSAKDGLSFNRLSAAIIGYKGPMIFLFRHFKDPSYEESGFETFSDDWIIGAFVDGEIKDNAKFGGDVNTCLFQIWPNVRIFRTTNGKGGSNFVYLNTVKIENSKLVYGFGFGGTTDEFRLWLDGDSIKEKSYASPEDSTFELGYLLQNSGSNNKLILSRIEIYGLGGLEALEAQYEHRVMLQQLKEKQRKVDKKQFLNEFDQEFLMGDLFKHKKDMEKRA